MSLAKFLEILCLSYNRFFRLLFRIIGSSVVDPFNELSDREGYYRKYAKRRLEDARKFDEKFRGYLKIKGTTILDLGCGFGGQSVYLALNGAEKVEGVEVEPVRIEISKRLAQKYGVSNITGFSMSTDTQLPFDDRKFDFIVCNDVFEHLLKPQEMLKECYRVLKRDGLMLISFGLPWYHPYGVHMKDIFPGPWNHLLFPEKVIVKIRNDVKKDGAGDTYADIGIAKMSVRKFKNLVRQSNFKVVYFDLRVIKNLNFGKYIPLLNELFINEVRCVLGRGRYHRPP